MKKRKGESVKRLELHRETLAVLRDPSLVLGGLPGETQLSGCGGAGCQTGTRCNNSICICD